MKTTGICLVFILTFFVSGFCQEKTIIINFLKVEKPIILTFSYLSDVNDDIWNIRRDTTVYMVIDEVGKYNGIPFYSLTIADEEKLFEKPVYGWNLQKGETKLILNFDSIYSAIDSQNIAEEKKARDNFENYLPVIKGMVNEIDSLLEGKSFTKMEYVLLYQGFSENLNRVSFDYFDYEKLFRYGTDFEDFVSIQVRIWGLKDDEIQKYEVTGYQTVSIKKKYFGYIIKPDSIDFWELNKSK